jgi:hypothetical protein
MDFFKLLNPLNEFIQLTILNQQKLRILMINLGSRLDTVIIQDAFLAKSIH